MTLFVPEIQSDASISECGLYRWWLTRTWDRAKPVVCWVMLNPSTADATQDDPTIRRCISFSQAWGFGALTVVNLFALRATDPRELFKHYPIDRARVEQNNHAIQTAAFNRLVIAAWGCHRAIGTRDVEVMQILKGQDVRCLARTLDGFPRHPLYMPGDTEPAPYAGRKAVPA